MASNVTGFYSVFIAAQRSLSNDSRLVIGAYLIPILSGIVVCSILRLLNVPVQIFAMIIGILIGVLRSYTPLYSTSISWVMDTWDPILVLSILVPLLIVKNTYTVDIYMFSKSIRQVLLITVVGFTAHMLLVGMTVELIRQRDTSLLHMSLVALFLAPNEVPLLPPLNVVKNMEMLMCGESIFGIATSVMTLQICLGCWAGLVTKWYHVVCLYLRFIVFSIAFGFTFAWTTLLWFRHLYNDSFNVITAVVSISGFVYNVSEYVFNCNGSIATFIVIYYLSQERPYLLDTVDRKVNMVVDVAHLFFHILVLIVFVSNVMVAVLQEVSVKNVIRGFGTYVLTQMFRLTLYLVISPALSRMGYGFDFSSAITIIWAAQKGPIGLILVMFYDETEMLDELGRDLHVYALSVVVCNYLINGTTLKGILNRFGLSPFNPRRINNILGAVGSVNETGRRLLSVMKLNKFYSDANWPIIYEKTILQDALSKQSYDKSLWKKQSVDCKHCGAVVILQPTKQQYDEFIKDVSLKVLKAQKVSVMKQVEMGILNKMEVRALLQAFEVAMDSTDLVLRLDELVAKLRDRRQNKTFGGPRTKKFLKKLTLDENPVIARRGVRRLFQKISKSTYFTAAFIAALCVEVLVLLVITVPPLTHQVIAFVISDFLCNLVLFARTVFSIASYSQNSYREALRIYFRNYVNKLKLAYLVLTVVDICTMTVRLIVLKNNLEKSPSVWKVISSVRLVLFVILIVFGVLAHNASHLLSHWERKKDLQLMHAYVIAKTLIVTYEDVIDLVPAISNSPNICEMFKAKLIRDHMVLSKELSVLEREKPGLTTNVKTTQVIRSISRFMRQDIAELSSSGLIDSFEFEKLMGAASGRQKDLDFFKTMDANPPKEIFYEIPWLGGEDYLCEFLYANVRSKIWNVGDVVCKRGEHPEGVIIIAAGVFKMTYFPTHEILERLKTLGELPVKNYLKYLRFDEMQEEFLVPGNTCGELACLTGRPYNCSIVADAPCQAFIIPRDVLRAALTRYADPVLGLEAKIWKYVTQNTATKLLTRSAAYQSLAFEQINMVASRGVVPNVDYYKILFLTTNVEYLVLLEGVVVDYVTREMFVAPCCLPRTIKKLIMPRSSLITTDFPRVKIMIIPFVDVDDYEMMLSIEAESTLVQESIAPRLNRNYQMWARERGNVKENLKMRPRTVGHDKPLIRDGSTGSDGRTDSNKQVYESRRSITSLKIKQDKDNVSVKSREKSSLLSIARR